MYDAVQDRLIDCKESLEADSELMEYAMWSSETEPFDPMEKAIHECYANIATEDKRRLYKQVHEYPIGGKPPMMTHVFQDESGDRVIAAKERPKRS